LTTRRNRRIIELSRQIGAFCFSAATEYHNQGLWAKRPLQGSSHLPRQRWHLTCKGRFVMPKYCVDCGKEISRKATRCRPCAYKARSQNKQWRERLSLAAAERAQDPEVRAWLSHIAQEAWERGVYDSEETQRRKAEASRSVWRNPERRRKGVQEMVRRWKDPEYREQMCEMSRRMWTNERRQRRSRRFTGERNPNWNGGSSFEPYPSEFNGTLKAAIRARDGYTCAMCGAQENGQAHDVHHIDYDRANNDPGNLIALCHTCHPVTNGHRRRWQKRLTGLMEQRGHI